MNSTDYAARINYPGPLEPTAVTLRALHIAHLQQVPFENLDIHLGRLFDLDHVRLCDKIVTRRRGGFCYELNGLFAWWLEELGFTVNRLAARVVNHNGDLGPEFDHLTLRVGCVGDAAATWLVDVGFGDCFLEPLRFDEQGEQPAGLRAYRIEQAGPLRWLWERAYDGTWARQYCFDLQPRQLHDFAPMCLWQQTSSASNFTQRRICTRATPDGRLTLSELRLITTQRGQRDERLLASEEEYRAALRDLFGLTLE